MKKIVSFITLLVFVFCIPGYSAAHAEQLPNLPGGVFSLPEIGFSMSIPIGYYTLQRSQHIPDGVSDDMRSSLNLLQRNMTEYDYAVGLKNDSSVRFKIACDLSVKKDYADMSESEFDHIINGLQTMVAHDRTVDSVKKVQTKSLLFAQRIYHSPDEFYIEYYTVTGGQEYYMIFFGTGSQPSRSITQEINSMIDSVIISPFTAPDAAVSSSLPSAASSYLVEINEPPLSFTLPDSFIGIKSTDGLRQIQGQWRELFEMIQPKMSNAGIYYYAVKTDESGRVKQMAVTARDIDTSTLQQVFDTGMAEIDKLLGRSVNKGKNTVQYPLNDKLYVNDVVFAKQYISADNYSWLLYQPTRGDVPFAFAYAGDGFVVTAADEIDMNKIIENFKGKTTRGTDIPGSISATDIAMQQFNTTVLIIVLCALIVIWAVVLLLYHRNSKIAQHQNVDSWIDRLNRLRMQNVLSDEEFERIKHDLMKRKNNI